MGIFGSHPGSWSIGGFRLPDFGISEWLAGNAPRNIQGGSTLVKPTVQEFLPQNFQSAETIKNLKSSGTVGGSVGGGVSGTGQVLSSSTGSGNTGGGGETYDPYAQVRNDISSGWDNYINSLDQQFESLNSQQLAQQGMANSQFNQGVNTLDLSKTQGMQQLGTQRTQAETNQTKTLRDLAENVRNSFQAGNVYLGARGAGDSSAANQYAYALTKMGSKQRGDIMNNTANIMNDIAGRETNLTNIYTTEKKNLQEGLNGQLMQVAQWYANAQQTIQQQKAQGELGKSQDLTSLSKDILNQAMARMQTIQQQAANRQSALDSWAMSNATNLAQLKTNMQSVSSPSYQLPQNQALGGPTMTSGGALAWNAPVGYGSDTTKKQTTLFG